VKLNTSFSRYSWTIGVVPLINVILILLLFFLLGSSFVLQPGVSISLPFSKFELAPQMDSQIVTITPGYPSKIFSTNFVGSIEEFSAELSKIPAEKKKPLVIRADLHVTYETIMAVSTSALEKGFQVILATTPTK